MITGNANLDPNDAAMFKSCIIECTTEPILVALRLENCAPVTPMTSHKIKIPAYSAWWSGNAKVEVCLVNVDDSGFTTGTVECQPVNNMGGDVVTLPQASRARVSLTQVAKNVTR